MADRHARDLAACLLVAEARRAAAEMAHARALHDEEHAVRREMQASARRDAAIAAWTQHLAGPFDPALGALLAGGLIAAADTADTADAARRMASDKRAGHAAQWRADDARCTQSRTLLRQAARRDGHARDERGLTDLADRVTFAWSRR